MDDNGRLCEMIEQIYRSIRMTWHMYVKNKYGPSVKKSRNISLKPFEILEVHTVN